MKINEIIQSRRLELGLTLKEVAAALHIAESTVSRYESSDIRNMGVDKIEALAKVLQCTPAFLMGWVDNSNTNDNEHLLTTYYKSLNKIGKQEAIKRIEELTHIIKYTDEKR